MGISGWRYARWRGDFYPTGLPQRLELSYAAERMNSVELNGSFYSLQKPASYERWRNEMPSHFVFAVKGGRFITHMLKLKNTEQALANFFASGALALESRLGPILWQLPERVRFDGDALDAFLDSLPQTTIEAAAIAKNHDERVAGRTYLDVPTDSPLRHAIEVRHDSFLAPEALDVLRHHDVALVTADSAGRWLMTRESTASFRYVRLHGSRELYTSGYTDRELDSWSAEIRDWMTEGQDVYVYFDNDAAGRAPFDAVNLARRLGLDG